MKFEDAIVDLLRKAVPELPPHLTECKIHLAAKEPPKVEISFLVINKLGDYTGAVDTKKYKLIEMEGE